MTHRNSPAAIAVIGLACRYPDAPTPRKLWENVLARRRQFRRLPDCRLPLADYFDADKTVADKTYGRQAALIDGFDFDWAGRRIPLSTVRTTDIVHWLALETSLSAVADAGYSRETLPGERTGVIIGNTLTGEQTRANTMRLRWPFVRRTLYRAAQAQGMDDGQLRQLTRALKQRYLAVFPPVDEDTLAGGLSNTIAGRICNYLNLLGGGFTIDGACSSSLLAVANAASRMMNGDLDLAIVGGVDISLDPFELVGFAKTGALSDGDMTVYDRGGKGFIPGEGCGFIVLKPLADARRDGNPVYAVIHGWGISSDGGGSGITAPNATGQALALERAYLHAPHGFKDLDFVEGHGTGTTVGDRTELESIARLLGRTPVPRGQLRPCGITSLKSIIGHAKAASGIGGLIKAVMAVNRRVVPPTAACSDPHQAFDGAARRLYPIRQGRTEDSAKRLTAGVSSMGFGGINCHITLVSGDAPDDRLKPPLSEKALLAHAQDSEIFMLGADSQAAMAAQIIDLEKMADGISIAELADLSAHLSRRLPDAAVIRAALLAGHPDELAARLNQLKDALDQAAPRSADATCTAVTPDIWLGWGSNTPRIGFLFPGQGAQQLNMGRILTQRYPWAQALVRQADQITSDLLGIPVSGLVFRDPDRAPGPEERDRWLAALSRTENAQPAICLASMLWLAFFQQLGVRPHVVGGHSLGELTACYAVGGLDAGTLLEFATRRGQAMTTREDARGAMVSLRCDASAASELISAVDGYVTLANLNSPHQTVLSGDLKAVETVARIAQERGINARLLPVSGAFHSRLCDDAARQVAAMTFLDSPLGTVDCRILSSTDGEPLPLQRPLSEHFAQQILSQVDFIRMTRNMASSCDLMVELGPGRILTGLVRDILGSDSLPCLPVEGVAGGAGDVNRTLAALFAHGVSLNWELLFENRLIRSFVPAAQKRFVVNPLEGLGVAGGPDEAPDRRIPDGIQAVLADAFNGVPDGLVSRYLESRGAFLNRLVQADLEFWNPTATSSGETAGVRGKTADTAAKTILFRLVAEVTGFAAESLSAESRLLDDLNLDSIKAGDLIARFARDCGITFPDPALLANAALGELIDAAGRLRGDAQPGDDGPPDDTDALGRRLLGMVAEVTGFPIERLDLSMRLLDDLNLDSIKAADLVARLASEVDLTGRVDAQALANASLAHVVETITGTLNAVAEPAPAPHAPTLPTAPDALTILLRQAARITGFAGDSLNLDRPVDQELAVGPDKLKTLIERTAGELAIDAHLDLEPLFQRSLSQIGEILNRMVAQQQPVGAAAPAAAPGQPSWVRNYVMELVDAPYPPFSENWRKRSENDWQKARVLILSSPDTAELADVLAQNLFYRGAATQTLAFDDDETPADLQNAVFSHLVALLPKNGHRENDRAALLDRMIRMRASLTTVPPAANAPRRTTSVTWVQFGGGVFGRDPRFASLDRGAAMALGASLHLERPDLKVRVVDVCPALDAEVIAWETIAEILTQESFAAVGYDLDRTRRILVPRQVQPVDFKRRGISWSGDDVILATGGGKGITAACALAVARETGVCMALVGRTPHPGQAESTPGTREIADILERYADLGLVAEYFACDMGDRDAVDDMLGKVTDRLGPVTGIIHGAGLNRPRLTGQVKPEQAFAETAPKVLGILHLLDALEATPPKLIMAMGSIIGITGMPGNGWYGFSNEVMDLALRSFVDDHPQTETVNVAYSIWRDEGMGARMGSVTALREKGIDAIPTDEGVSRFLKLFTHDPGHRQVVVSARMGGLDTWHRDLPDDPHGLRFLERRIHLTPGVEAAFSARLSLESDPYLKDHHFQGSYLFPTVFGLEAMTQATGYLCGLSALSRVQFRDVRLSRPITVDPESGTEIIVRAILAEKDADGLQVVQAGIMKPGTGVQTDFFSATLILDPPAEAPRIDWPALPPPLPLVPATDLYRSSLLFQGVRFQGIQTVREIREEGEDAGQTLFTTRVRTPSERSAAAFAPGLANDLSLGDAFFTDTLLQSAALLVPQDVSLPISIGRLDLFPAFFTANAPATVRTQLIKREAQDLVFRVTAIDAHGGVMAQLDDYRLRILTHHPEYPLVADLVSPEARDRRLLEQAVADACQHFSVGIPCLTLACVPGLHDRSKVVRQEMEIPFLNQTVSAAAEQVGLDAPSSGIRWQENGRPVVADVDRTVLDISLSHEDRYLLCIGGPGPVGCDLAAITKRDREGWAGLLGSGRSVLLDRLMADGDALDRAGTRIWAAAEVCTKCGCPPGAPLSVVDRKGDAVLFAADESIRILTLVIRLTWGAPQIVAFTVGGEVVPRVPEFLLTADYPGYEPLYETRPFEMIEGGPQGQLVFVQRLPVTFQPSANLSRTIYFSNFIKWMGNTREASAWPVLARMSEQFASGRWGGVTNYGHLKILGEGGTSDQVEILMWVSDNSGPENSTMTLSYDFRRMLRGGGYQRLAFCRLQTTWVEILGPGVARVAPYPPYYGQFIEDMCPRFDAPDTPEPMEESLAHLFDSEGDRLVYEAPAGPVVLPIVREQTFETSLAHANLVGNIYYANYYEWQGQIRDRFFYELIPDYFHGIGERGELLALESRVDHLREAMPFDRLVLTLAVKTLRTCSVTFHVDYFRLEPDGGRIKIAYGMHRAVWVKRDHQGRAMAAPFPERVRVAFDAAIDTASGR
ncbi:hypothetical protein DSCO28_52900 [Desulfosarcina ovata subsp. sediminis]|uniref:Polyketide synthase n=1 Tax=Desulfosarcina ovata subsp. sediminis TaxID=885957 RepID=A0A5K7ZX20_9BACT|nr:type I polyketide synthase [Desulfosarcina ovata]BBO84724.1 hypothetical protein DSCO28_52900 [Desulfosarcina ovata subsp. sediminis]